MVQLKDVEDQIKALGLKIGYWGRPEIHELPRILMPKEQIISVVNGQYEGGFATLVATDHRLLLIDKKPLFLTVEDLRYDMIAELDYNARLVDATICVFTVNKKLSFTSIRKNRLRDLTHYLQQRVMELKQHYGHSVFQQELEAAQELSRQPEPAAVANDSSLPLPASTPAFPRLTNPYTRSPLRMRRRFTIVH